MTKFFHLIYKINNFRNYLKIIIAYIIRSLKNYFKIFGNSNFNDYCIPNLSIKNVVMINPNKIKYVNSIPLKFYKSTKFIMNFDWDKKNKLLKKYEQKDYKSITCNELFIKNIAIKKCKSYFFFKKKIIKLKEYKKCRNNNDIVSFLNQKIKLYKSIKKNGLKKNFNSNVEFMIDRNYNLVKINSGDHRFAISRILKLKKIPVEIKVLHIKCLSKISDRKIKVNKINKIIKNLTNKYA